MVNNCVVQGCVVGTAKQNVTLREFPKLSRQDASYGGVSYRRLEATGLPTRHSHVCSPHFISLDFVNDVEYNWLRKETSHQQDCCPNHVSIKTRGFATLTQSAAGRRGPARPSSRARQRMAHASKLVFVN